MNTDPITLAILAILVINTLLRVRTYRLEQRRKRLAERRWMAIQAEATQIVRAVR